MHPRKVRAMMSLRWRAATGSAALSTGLQLPPEEEIFMGVDHAWEKFSSEIRFALVSDAPIQERLGNLISGVSHLKRDSFPDEHVWDEFRKLVNETTKRASRQQSPENGTITKMSDDEAREYLQSAFNIYSHLAKAFGRTEFVI